MDTTKEKLVEGMASNHSYIRTDERNILDGSHTRICGEGKDTALQRVVLVGEAHKEPIYEVSGSRLHGQGLRAQVKSWGPFFAQPSKIVAAMIDLNGFTPPPVNSNWQIWQTIKANDNPWSLQNVMKKAEDINRGQDPNWGAENNVIGTGSFLQDQGKVPQELQFAENSKTHIENPVVREAASTMRVIALVNGGDVTGAKLGLYIEVDIPACHEEHHTHHFYPQFLQNHGSYVAHLPCHEATAQPYSQSCSGLRIFLNTG